ncbi:Uncharacterized protein FKW44_014496, partial [Caligus rogercresseyi]
MTGTILLWRFSSESNRDKSRSRGPPRMRRGGGSMPGRGRGSYHGGGDSSEGPSDSFRSRGTAPRRGGMGRGNNYHHHPNNNNNHHHRYDRPNHSPNNNNNMNSSNSNNSNNNPSSFSGSIDTWNPSGSRLVSSMSSSSNKDAFDNAAAEDWDNEEYTGSLAESKVFTAKNTPNKNNANAPPAAAAAAPSKPSPVGQRNEGSSGQNYSQSIDLSTLLQKPTTQSSLNPSQNIMHLQQGGGGESLKSGGQPSTQTSTSSGGGGKGGGDLYYNAAAATAPGNNPPVPSSSSAAPSYSALIKSKPSAGKSSRLPPPSKIPSSAVEMPGDSLTKLD